MTRPFAGSGERGAADDEGAFAGEDRKKALVGGVQDLVTPYVVDIILYRAVNVGGVW